MTAPVDAAAALERGRPILIVSPPTPQASECSAVWPLVAGNTPVLIVTDSPAAARAWSGAVPQPLRFQAVTGLDRAARLLATGAVDVVAGTPADFGALSAKSALKGDTIRTVVLAWPESLGAGERAALEGLLPELPEAQRIVLSWNPVALDAFLEAHARRPHIVGDLPLGENARPLPLVGEVRYLVTGNGNQDAGIAMALDALDPATHLVWRRGTAVPDSAGAIICADLPSRSELVALAAAGPVTLLLRPEQVAYARSIATLRSLSGASGAGTAPGQARAAIAQRIDQGDLAAELALLAPLFERYDAAEVAAAVYALRQPGAGSREPSTPLATRTRIHVNVGKKDRAAAKDIVGALIREVGLSKDDIGRIDVKEMHSMVEVAGAVAERTVARLSGLMIRGRRVSARLDR
ncbi:MAG TPA: DbpA RNA binding domain-containing protein [Gemmatimonadales bacterium]|nr:DbpA RNA binding domain-containing protein [Gemmatimonadales bacterium]